MLMDHELLKNAHVYLVEDDVMLREQLTLTIRDAGISVHSFDSVRALLEFGIDLSPAVIVSDMVLPGLSGLEMFQKIRLQGVETPVVFISGYSEPHQIIEGMKQGAVDFLWKPFKAAELLKVIVRALQQDAARTFNQVNQNSIMQLWESLSEREREVCRLMLVGYGNKNIATRLSIQPDTVNKHRMKVLSKLGVSGRPQLIEKFRDFCSLPLK